MVNFLPLIGSIFAFYMVKWSTFTFFMVKSTFYVVDFSLFLSVSVKRRLQTGDKVQTEVKMQTESCRPGVKMQTRF